MQKKSEKKYKRIGKCQPKKCGSICCRLCMGTGSIRTDSKYYKNFDFKPFKIGKEKIWFFERVCSKLSLNGKCLMQKTKPITCKKFPVSPEQDFYKVCKKLGCTYRFEEIKNAKR